MKTFPQSSVQSTRKCAFTLVELLVTILIIAVLATLGFMGTTRLRIAANRAVSTGNLKSLQIANASYAAGNNGRFAATFVQDASGKTSDWVRSETFLDEYLGVSSGPISGGQAARVPVNALDPTAYRAKKNSYDKLWASYGMVSRLNYSGGGSNVDSSYLMTELSAPHRTAAFTTAVNWLVQYGGRFYWNGEEGKVNAPAMAYRYYNKVIVAFYDGHVGELTMDEIRAYDKQGGSKNIFWDGTAK